MSTVPYPRKSQSLELDIRNILSYLESLSQDSDGTSQKPLTSLYMKDSNGKRYIITVSTSGTLVVTAG